MLVSFMLGYKKYRPNFSSNLRAEILNNPAMSIAKRNFPNYLAYSSCQHMEREGWTVCWDALPKLSWY